jgi:hypothetical protein
LEHRGWWGANGRVFEAWVRIGPDFQVLLTTLSGSKKKGI